MSVNDSSQQEISRAPAGDENDPADAGDSPDRSPGAESTEASPAKKSRPGAKMRAAICEILERRSAGARPEYRETAERHGVSWKSLKTQVCRYDKGLVDLGDPVDMEQQREINLRAELERSLGLLGKYERHLNDAFEALLIKAEGEFKEGNFLAFDQLQVPKVVAQLAVTTGLRAKKEKGVLEILEQLMELQKRREQAEAERNTPKLAQGTVIVEAAPKMNQATAAAILQSGAHATIRNILARQAAEMPIEQ